MFFQSPVFFIDSSCKFCENSVGNSVPVSIAVPATIFAANGSLLKDFEKNGIQPSPYNGRFIIPASYCFCAAFSALAGSPVSASTSLYVLWALSVFSVSHSFAPAINARNAIPVFFVTAPVIAPAAIAGPIRPPIVAAEPITLYGLKKSENLFISICCGLNSFAPAAKTDSIPLSPMRPA